MLPSDFSFGGDAGALDDQARAREEREAAEFKALKHAALNKLKERKRSKSIVLPAGEEGVKVLNVRKLSRAQSRGVLKGVWREEDDTDVEHMLHRIQARLARVGIQHPTIEVRYKGVSVETSAVIGDRRIPTLVRTVSSRVEAVLGARNRTPYAIIDNVSGILRPGRLTLLLGPPGSGKSVLLKTLAGRMTKLPGVKVSGEITYNGRTFDQFVPERSAAYISQVDDHFGELTVRETLQFSAACQSSGYQRGMLEAITAREAELGIEPDPEVDAYMRAKAFGGKNNVDVELVIRLLGLDICADTVVGNRMLRGISGGQRKRVTTGEMVVGNVKAVFADEISTGLDSNTTYQIMRSLRSFCHVTQATFMIGLLQPPPEVYDLFDAVMLISSGRICYHGPLEGVLPMFEQLGFACPLRKGMADFLQEVTTATDQKKYWVSEVPYKYVTVQTIEAAYHATPAYQRMMAELERLPAVEEEGSNSSSSGGGGGGGGDNCGGGALSGGDSGGGGTATRRKGSPRGEEPDVEQGAIAPSPGSPGPGSSLGGVSMRVHDHRKAALAYTKYGAGYWALFKLLFARAYLLSKRTKLFVIVRTIQMCLMSFVVATLFLHIPTTSVEDGNLMLGVQFYSAIYMLIGGVAEMHLLTERLSVFYKQREMNFYPGWCFALPTFVFRIPYALLDSTIWSLIIYWAVGFNNSARFLVFWLLLLLIEIWSTSLFQAVAAWCKEDTIASAVASFMLLILMNTGGFIVNKNDIKLWWKAVYWCNPWTYFTVGMAVNEFTSSSWSTPDPATGVPMGIEVLEYRGFGTEYWWVWLTVGVALASILLNVAAFLLACTVLSGPVRSAILTEEAVEELEINRGAPMRPPAAAVSSWRGSGRGAAALVQAAFSRKISDTTDLELGKLSSSVAKGPSEGAEALHLPAANGAAVGSAQASTNSSSNGCQGGHHASSYQSALPFEPLVFTFKNVSYSVPMPKGAEVRAAAVSEGPHAGQLRLLDSIDGAFKPHVLCALMGASGAGKTTLMDVLAGRKTGGTITGEMHIKGFPKEQRTFARVTGYVEQDDSHLPQTTLHEALLFSANLRLPTTVDAATRARFVDEVMELVELDRLRNAYVGVLGAHGLSLEQRKRLTIACELVANPSILFLDEPTTGLDARAASIVMSAVRNTVNTGRTVVCTVHQPSITIFESFDELLLLKPGGECIYFGPMGSEASQLIAYFSAVPGVNPIRPRYNPANWMLEETAPHNEDVLGTNFTKIYEDSALAKEMRAEIEELHVPQPGAHPLTLGELHVTSFSYQILVLLKRNFLMYWRFPEYNLIRLLVTFMVAMLFGTLFFGEGTNRSTAAGVTNICGVLYACTLFVGVTNAMTVQHVASMQRSVSYRERAAGMYSALPFSLAQLLVEIPYVLVQALLFCNICYWMVGFEANAGKFFLFFLLFTLTLLYFTYFGVQNVMLTPNVALANLFTSFFFGFWNLLSGFLIPQSRIPGYWIWVYYSNPVTWTLYGLVTSQLGNLDGEWIMDFQGQKMPIPQFLEDTFGYKYSMLGPCVAILFAYVAFFSTTGAVAFKRINFQNR